MIQGIYTALVTPMKTGTVDLPRVAALVDRQLEAKVQGMAVCASTGEGSLLTPQERQQVIGAVTKRVQQRASVIVGIAEVRVDMVLEASRVASDLGADACLVPSPSYIRPSQEGMAAFYTAIADQAALPIVLYNVPSRTASDILPETVGRLAEHERIIGIKEATGSVQRAQQVIAAAKGKLAVLSGDDPTTLSLLAAGG